MPIRAALRRCALAALLLLAGCGKHETGPIGVSAIGEPPRLLNPNLKPLDPPAAFLLEAVAQGLVRFNAAGEIEPGLAQSWIVSDDGLRYTFRLARAQWKGDGKVTADQVVARLRAAASNASRNPLKPLLGAIDNIVAMTDDVLEISLKAPRPNFLQLLAQPEMAIIRDERGTGPWRAEPRPGGPVLLTPPPAEDEENDESGKRPPPILLRGERAALAVARFRAGRADFVTGGTAGDLPVARAADEVAGAIRFDPVIGLFGLAFTSDKGPLGDVAVRQALSMAVDRTSLVSGLNVPDLRPRPSLLPPDMAELGTPALPSWAAASLPARRRTAAAIIASLDEPLTIRVALPDGPGYRLVFAYLRRDWRAIGVNAEAVPYDAKADLRLIDDVADANSASWYLRRFTCRESPICDKEADAMLEAARVAPGLDERRTLLANVDRIYAELTPFIPITAPIRWSLVSSRLNGFQPNMFGIHVAGELIAAAP